MEQMPMLPFFDGLIPEGWLLEIAGKNWKLNARDRMGLLLACCRDCIGAVSIEEGPALTLNGKKKKLRKKDFLEAMNRFNPEPKVIENMFMKFLNSVKRWHTTVLSENG